jgi:hypothetical protein
VLVLLADLVFAFGLLLFVLTAFLLTVDLLFASDRLATGALLLTLLDLEVFFTSVLFATEVLLFPVLDLGEDFASFLCVAEELLLTELDLGEDFISFRLATDLETLLVPLSSDDLRIVSEDLFPLLCPALELS